MLYVYDDIWNVVCRILWTEVPGASTEVKERVNQIVRMFFETTGNPGWCDDENVLRVLCKQIGEVDPLLDVRMLFYSILGWNREASVAAAREYWTAHREDENCRPYTLNGIGGCNRYFIYHNGEVVLSRGHLPRFQELAQPTIDRARENGIRLSSEVS